MHNRKVRLICSGLFLATIVLAALSVRQGLEIKNSNLKSTYEVSDDVYIRMAEEIWSRKSKESIDSIRKDRFPIAMHIGSQVCIELRLLPGSLGGSPVYCFDEHDKRLKRRFDDVE